MGETGTPGGAGVSTSIGEVERMFLGQFRHSLDDKGRLTIPVRFREMLLTDGAYIMQGFEKNLLVLPSPVFERLSQRMSQMSWTDPVARLLRRLVFSTANPAEIDKAGRILIPQFLRQSANLTEEVVLVGNGEFFEVWSAEQWAAQDEQLQDTQANAHRFAALDLTSA